MIGRAMAYMLFAVLVWLLAYFVSTYASFTRDKQNSYRRYCRRCGQRQELHENCFGFHYWADMGCVLDTQCNCHFWAD